MARPVLARVSICAIAIHNFTLTSVPIIGRRPLRAHIVAASASVFEMMLKYLTSYFREVVLGKWCLIKYIKHSLCHPSRSK